MTAPHRSGPDLLFDLSTRGKFCLTGGDRVRFLNGQVTNDVRKATESAAIEACILSAKGKVQGHVFVSAGSNCFFLDADAELREALPVRLERYVIADDVQIENVSERFSIFHLLSPKPPDFGFECRSVLARRFVEPGWDIWVESDRRDALLKQLAEKVEFVDPAVEEIFRVEQGIPRWGRELTEEIIPIEANLESRTIDYDKGCYIGQEVISRMKMSGQTNKRLCGLISLSAAPLATGMKLATRPAGEKEAGWITSAVHSRLGEIALGYVKRGSNQIGTKLEAFSSDRPDVGPAPVEIVALPFAPPRG